MSNRNLEYDVRRSLLDYYTSETIAHATYLLTFALIGVAVVSLHLGKITLVAGLSILIAASIRPLSRLFYWGWLGHAIVRVPRDIGVRQVKVADTHEKEDGYIDDSLETLVLHYAADNWVQKYHKKITWFNSFRNWFALFLLILVIAIVIIWFAFPYIFLL